MTKRTIVKGRTKFYVERDSKGKFVKWVSRARSQRADRRSHSKTVVKSGYGHRGDQKRRIKKLM